jgi:CRP/FNR family transcriptional regulator, cyclic AMP receptor protein
MMKRNTMTMDPRNRLRDVPGFRRLSEDSLERLDSLSTEMTVDKGYLLTRQGAPGHEAFVILEGTAAFWRTGEPVSILTAGALVGELALFDGIPRTGNVVAVTPLRVLVLNPDEFDSLCDDLGFGGWARNQADDHKRDE